jgi:hypothetical protein
MTGSTVVPLVVTLAVAAATGSATAEGRSRGLPATPSALVAVSIQVDGETTPLYPAPDGSGRFYFEARPGRRYSVTLASRGAERLGVVLTVDGLNVISGERDQGRGRMYVLDPWQRTTVRGWRTSLQEAREFTFVDEQLSYATRSGKANAKMGWIEAAVYRELHAYEPRPTRPDGRLEDAPAERESGDADAASGEGRHKSSRSDEPPTTAPLAGAARSYPGTGWGQRTQDPVVLVSFEPESWAAESTTLRYEYRSALVALGVLPRRRPARDRLWERDHADSGFAQPPLW